MPPLLDHSGSSSFTRTPDRTLTFVHLPSYISEEGQAAIAHPPDPEGPTPTADFADLPSLPPLITLPRNRYTSETVPLNDGEASPMSPTGAGGLDDPSPPVDVWQAHSHLLSENEEPPNQPAQDETDIQHQRPLAAALRALESGNVQVAEGFCLEAHTTRGMEQESERHELRTHFNAIANQHDANFSLQHHLHDSGDRGACNRRFHR